MTGHGSSIDAGAIQGVGLGLRSTEQFREEMRVKYETARAEFESGKEFVLPRDYNPPETLDRGSFVQATQDTPIPSSNKGYQLMKLMGWQENTGLGKKGMGRKDPVPVDLKLDFLGLGKASEYEESAKAATATRVLLEVEKEDTLERRMQRAEAFVKEEALKAHLKEAVREFYCDVCDKQYKKASEFEVHLSSYDHGHKKRFKEMREMNRNRDVAGRQKREKLAQEKEHKRMAQMLEAAKAAAQPVGVQPDQPPPPPPPPSDTSGPAPPPLPQTGGELKEDREKIKIGFGGMKKPGVSGKFGSFAKPPLKKFKFG